VVRKPGATFDAQVVITQVPPPGIVPPEMEVVSVYMQLAIDTCFFLFNGDSMEIVGGTGGDITFTGEKTVLDSMGWDIKWHYLDYYPNGDFLDIWLIGGAAMFENGCILNLGFTMLDVGTNPACPFALCDNGEAALSFVEAEFNEGLPFIVTHDLRVIRNRPPEWVTADQAGSVHEGVGTACAAQDSEQDTLWYDICAIDYDPDSLRLSYIWDEDWATDCANGTEGSAFGVVNPLERFNHTGCWTVWYAPDKVCAGTYVDTFIVESTYTTGQPCFDTLYITTTVLETQVHVFWGQNSTGDPGPGGFTTDGDFFAPDTTDFWACGQTEIPIYLCLNEDYAATVATVWSIDMIIDYDTDLTLGHIGNEGLATENIGALTYTVDEAAGVICVSMAFNDSLYAVPDAQFCEPIMYVEFSLPSGVAAGYVYDLSIDHVKLNEGDPTVCWQYGAIEVIDFSVSGNIHNSDNVLQPVADVTVDIYNAASCTGDPEDVVTTDVDGDYGWNPAVSCTDYCFCVSKADEDMTSLATAADASLILRSLCNQVILTHDQQIAGDVTCDGTVSAYDAALLLQYVVGVDVSAMTCIGQWVFEHVTTGEAYFCVSDLTTDLSGQDFTAALIGDVTQNYWPGAPKSVVGTSPAVAFLGRSATITLSGDVYSATLDLVGVTARSVTVPEGLQYEWNVVDGVTKIAVAGTEPVVNAAITVVVESGESLELYGSVNEVPFATRSQKVPVIPSDYSLSQNYPNPFNPETTIEFGLPEDAQVKVTVFNVLGQVATELVDAEMTAGYHVVTWDASEMASGVYFYRIQADNFTATKRMVLMK
jgi:hypothetical protein